MQQSILLQMSRDELMELLIETAAKLKPSGPPIPQAEIIDRKELMKRLGLSEVSVIKLEKRNKIKPLNLGGAIRYDWAQVLETLKK